jgi:hypothetical protein
VSDEERAQAIAHWLGEQKGEPVRFEKVEPGTSRSFRRASSVNSTRCRPGSSAANQTSGLAEFLNH